MKFLSVLVLLCLSGCVTATITTSQQLYDKADKFCGTTNPNYDAGGKPDFTPAQQERMFCILNFVRTQCLLTPIDVRTCGKIDQQGGM